MIRVAIAIVALLAIAVPLAAAEPAPQADTAPDDAWPTSRGSIAGTGRSAARLRFPLREAWRRDFEKAAFGAVPVIADGTVFIGDLDGSFYALALDTGETRWKFKTEAAGFPSAAAISSGPGRLAIVGDDTGVVRAFDAATGAVRWEYETDGEISGGPTILETAAGERVLVGSQDASLSCLAVADGTPVWKHSIADQIRCSPTVVRTAAGDRVLIAGCDGKLHVIDAATGEEKTAAPIDGPTGTTPAAAGDRVFFGTEGGVFFAIDILKGETAWRTKAAAAGQSYRSSAAIADGLAVVGSRGRAVEAFAVADGARVWRAPMRGRVDASPAVVEAAGPDAAPARPVALVADGAGRIVALDAATGELVWEFEAGGRFSAGPAVASGRVVIASDDGTIWCFASGGG